MGQLQRRGITSEQKQAFETDQLEQYHLEKWWVDQARQEDVERMGVLRDSGRASSDKKLQAWIRSTADEVSGLVFQSIEKPRRGGRRHSQVVLEKLCKSITVFELSHLIVTHAVNAVLSTNRGFTLLSTMTTTLSEVVNSELRFRAMAKVEPDLKNLVAHVLKGTRASVAHRRRVFSNLFHRRAKDQKIGDMFGTPKDKITHYLPVPFKRSPLGSR